MAISCGIVGLPNVGKSTLFNALTRSQCAAENFPFCTIEPNQGRVSVPDERLFKLAEIARPQKIVPAVIHFWDIAGLVKGAAKGEGLGNQFLHHIREVDAILHVVRCFSDDKVIHVEGMVDPIADLEIIETELILADIESLERWIARSKTGKHSKTVKGQESCALWLRLIDFLSSGGLARHFGFSDAEKILMQGYPLLTAKPVLYVANSAAEETPELQRFKEYAHKKNLPIFSLCIAQEAELSGLSDQECAELCQLLDVKCKLPELICASMRLLELNSFFTVGATEVRAWAIPVHSSAQQAAGVIHSDMARGFIRAEVIAYQDFIDAKGELQARARGKLRLEGKEYSVQDGDILHFRFHV